MSLYKKAQVPSTLTWFVAFVVIFFIMFIFLTFALIIAGAREVSKTASRAEYEGEIQVNLIETKNLVAFLNTPVKDCYFIKTPDAREEWTNAIIKQDFDEASFRDLIELFVIGEPNKDITSEYLYPMGRHYSLFNEEYAIYAKLFVECTNHFFRDNGMFRSTFVIEFINGKELSFQTSGIDKFNTARITQSVTLPVRNKLIKITKIPPIEGSFEIKENEK